MNHLSKDLIITVAELQSQGISYDSSTTELVMQGQRFQKHLSLRKFFGQVCIEHCQRKREKGQMCFLVEEDTCFAIWHMEGTPKSSEQPFDTETEAVFQQYHRSRPLSLSYRNIRTQFRRSRTIPGHPLQVASSASVKTAQLAKVQTKAAAPTHLRSTPQTAGLSSPSLVKQPTLAEKQASQSTPEQRVYRGITYRAKTAFKSFLARPSAQLEKHSSQTPRPQRIYRGASY